MQKLVQYEPWSLLRGIQESGLPLFERNFLWRDKDRDTSEISASDWSPRVDVCEKSDRFVLLADLPGVDPKEIEISMEDNALTIRGERRLERQVEKEDYSRLERFSGTFYRRFMLPEGIEAEKIQAKGRNGVLEITIPKKTQKVPKTIQVKVED